MIKRLSSDEAVATLPRVVVQLLQHRLIARLSRIGGVHVAIIMGEGGFRMTLHRDDWNLLMDNILYDPETMADGEPDPTSSAVPNSVAPYRLGSYLSTARPTQLQRRFNPRTPVNQKLLLFDSDAFLAKVRTEIARLFVS